MIGQKWWAIAKHWNLGNKPAKKETKLFDEILFWTFQFGAGTLCTIRVLCPAYQDFIFRIRLDGQVQELGTMFQCFVQLNDHRAKNEIFSFFSFRCRSCRIVVYCNYCGVSEGYCCDHSLWLVAIVWLSVQSSPTFIFRELLASGRICWCSLRWQSLRD